METFLNAIPSCKALSSCSFCNMHDSKGLFDVNTYLTFPLSFIKKIKPNHLKCLITTVTSCSHDLFSSKLNLVSLASFVSRIYN